MNAPVSERDKGSYVLLIRLASPCDVVLRGKNGMLEPGLYAYCGSAMGPGGLKARIERHRRRDKKIHWHVDQVTTQVPVYKVGVSFDLSECHLVDLLARQTGAGFPIPGFGSTDCQDCKSHFLKLPSEKAFKNLGLQSFGS